MSITSGIAIYFIIWWVTLFMVLPFGVQNAHEAGQQVDAGHDAGAPVNPRILQKVLITTAIATVLFAIVYWSIVNGILVPA
jgi:predicted secreted protein